MVPRGKVSAIIRMVTTKIIEVMTVRWSRFFSQTPEPADALYIEEAMSSETPVPFPECIRIRMTVKIPDRAQIINKTVLSTPTL